VLSLLLGLLLCSALAARAADDRDRPLALTPEEQARLEKESAALDEQADALYRGGQYTAATKRLEKALAMRQRLYPAARYPQGHPHLATSLNNLGFLLQEQGEYGKALDYFRQALVMYQRLYPADRYPQGHPELANSLNNLGTLLQDQGEYGKALDYLQQALEMYQKLYPTDRYPQGHHDLALSLDNLGGLLQAQGEYGKALDYHRQALAMRQRLYPAGRYPQGHPALAQSLNNLGALLQEQGEYGKALGYYRQALQMYQRLYPADRYPQGHPELATSLGNLGGLLRDQGDYGQALGYCRQALEMWQRLYPEGKYPQGHPDLAISLTNLGFLLSAQGEYGKALDYYRQALEMFQRLYPQERYPKGHPDLAKSLNELGSLLQAQGEYSKALGYYRQALEMRQRLYPQDRYPQGHHELASSLSNLGTLLRAQGEYGKAQGYYRQALEMYQRLYPQERYPKGHPDLAGRLNDLGMLLQDQGEYAKALGYYRQALEMRQRLYPQERYPQGHPELAASLHNLGSLLQYQGEYGKALGYSRQALEMEQKFYPADRYPHGHPLLAASLNSLGDLLQDQGEYAQALGYLRQSLEMRQQLYPQERYPQGHHELATTLSNLGILHQAQGEYGKALGYYRQALEMKHAQLQLFAESASEAEALNLLAKLIGDRDAFLSAASGQALAPMADHAYVLFSEDKAGYGQMLRTRQRFLRGLADDETRSRLQSLLDTRQQLARLLLAPADPSHAKERLERLKQLTNAKEKLERELAARVPELQRERARKLIKPTDLAARLPAQAVLVDTFRYRTYDAKARKWGEARYAAFVLRHDRPVVRVELGDGDAPAKGIEAALQQWRQDIANNHHSQAAEQLRRLVWEPLAKHFPEGTSTVYLCPDGEFSALPWAALPGDRKGTVLLDDYAFALVPDGLALLEQLAESPQAGGSGRLLLVGGVAYDDKPPAPREQTAKRSADVGDKITWPALAGTADEVQQVREIALRLPRPPAVTERRGKEAGTDRVLHDLQEAHVAHLATHGFFAAPKTDVRAALFDERTFGFGVGMERRGAATRNPLVQSGLVLAGANVLPRDGLFDDGGILTAEAIAGADLRGLRLAVLSACETGLGETNTLGQGVFGLQRAFHLGGCRDVVATLWKVDDEATAALMALFYRNLWEKGEAPLDALRHAQLGLMHNPQAVARLARERGGKFAEVVKEVDAAVAGPRAASAEGPAPVKQWAAFVLSGAGR
jgi:tetratricopeptide (TPR) repeat protein